VGQICHSLPTYPLALQANAKFLVHYDPEFAGGLLIRNICKNASAAMGGNVRNGSPARCGGSKVRIIIAASSSCGLLNQKPHWNHGFAGVLSIPKFANKIAAK
jgi:hypothetical protein